MFHAVTEIRPVWVICENVPGIINLGQLERVCLDLESVDYETQSFVVSANAVGAPHLRYRVFIVANTNGSGLEEHERERSDNGAQQPSTVGGSRPGGFRLTEPPLCRATARVRNRSYRLKALGNAVVPQQAFPFFEAICQVETALR
jgi:DNA (cytosine-5)-methyltransferase 1